MRMSVGFPDLVPCQILLFKPCDVSNSFSGWHGSSIRSIAGDWEAVFFAKFLFSYIIENA
jgi:hypothetical protein